MKGDGDEVDGSGLLGYPGQNTDPLVSGQCPSL